MAIITISRGTLSGGRAVAESLAARLDYPCVAREVLQEAARRLGAPPEDVEENFETAPGLWARLSRKREKYVLAVQASLADAAKGGDLVYHGIAGQFLLRDIRSALRVRLVAPLELRVKAILGERAGMSRGEAEQFIANADLERSRRTRLMYGADIEDPSLYDMTVNIRTMSLDTACGAIAEAAGRPEFESTDAVREELAAFAEACRRRLEALVPEDGTAGAAPGGA